MFNRNRSKNLLIQSSTDIQGERSSRQSKKKHYLTHEFDVLFHKINNIRDWTKNLIKDSMAIVSLEADMNIKGYLEDSEKKHLGRTKLEILGADMIHAAKGSGIKGGTYEKALVKVGECERRLGTYGRDFVVDVCSSFIRPLKYFLEVELNKLLEEREMLTSRKIDFDYHVKQMNSGKTDKNVVHKLKMAEMALEFQYIHAKEVLQNIEASECQVGHLSDLISVQSVYHQKCLAELEKLKMDLKKMSSNAENEKKSLKASGSTRKVSKKNIESGEPLVKSSCVTRIINNLDRETVKTQDPSTKLGPQVSEEQFQCKDQSTSRTDQHVVRRCGKAGDGMRSKTDKQSFQRNAECPVKDSKMSRNPHRSPTVDKPPNAENITESSGQGSLKEPANKDCTDRRTVKRVISHNANCGKPHSKPSCQYKVEEHLTPETATPEGFSTDDSTASKETHVIPIPVRNNYRRDVGKIYFTPRQDLE